MTLAYQSEFIDLCMQLGVLRFGSFTLKSGRESPYFFNAGLFNTGAAIGAVGRAYAAALAASRLEVRYAVRPRLQRHPAGDHHRRGAGGTPRRNLPFAFNRKEAKDHGEGGRIVGSPLKGRVLIVDDVITAGTAIRESIDIIQRRRGTPAGVLLALDRQERAPDSEFSAVQEVRSQHRITGGRRGHLSRPHGACLQGRPGRPNLSSMRLYRERYGLAD